jgi:hypothetical protein
LSADLKNVIMCVQPVLLAAHFTGG